MCNVWANFIIINDVYDHQYISNVMNSTIVDMGLLRKGSGTFPNVCRLWGGLLFACIWFEAGSMRSPMKQVNGVCS